MKRLNFKLLSTILTILFSLIVSFNVYGKSTAYMSLPNLNDNSFKTYMPYTTITNKSSDQWKLQQNAETAENGLRVYDGRYMIAVGTYYADKCGVKLNIYLDNEHVLYCITGDVKRDADTDPSNRYVEKNGNIIEFIVDDKKIDTLARKMGDMSYSPNLEGQILKIEQVED